LGTHLDALERVITDVVAPAAASTDEQGTFPLPAITALGEAGILGLTANPDVGGGGGGLLEAVTAKTGAHLAGARLEHLGETLIQQPIPRADCARLRLATDRVRTFLADTLTALESGRADAQLRVLEVKAVAAEEGAAGCDLAMKLCGGAAFRKETGIERHFRDSLAVRVMAPTTDALLDFVGRAVSGLPLLGPVS